MAKRLSVKLTHGFSFELELNSQQNAYTPLLQPWLTPVKILKLVTLDDAQLLALSGLRSPYPGQLGVVRKGALADLILVNGDPLTNLDLVADPEADFSVIMKDGELVKAAW